MSVEGGQMLLHYRVLEKIGSGGMGQVWLAEDTKLQRKVALKTLPPRMVADERLRDQFEREARAIAALNHPNIVTAYSIEEADGTPFLTMELVEGQPLTRLLGSALPLERFFGLAIPLADAVGAAHTAGILHRDLKPDNVMVTGSGQVKVLDFGLAKLRGDPDAADEVEGPTQERKLVGSAAYMSPEQAECKAVGTTSDVFSLGIVLYQLATGRRPFSGETSIAVMSSILKDHPPDVTAIDPQLPPHLGRIVRRSLDKDPARRYPTAGELRIELELLREELAASPRDLERQRSVPVWPRAALAAALVLLSVAAIWGWWRPPVQRDAAMTVSQQTFDAGVETNPALAPRGAFMAYEAASADGDVDVFLQRIDGHSPINLTEDSPAFDGAPAISPDGSRIAFRSDRDGGGIFVMGATGEDVRRVTDFGHDPAWSPDGTRLVLATERVVSPLLRSQASELWIADVKSGAPHKIHDGDAVQPSWSPDGRRIAFWTAYVGEAGSGERDIGTVAVDGTGLAILEAAHSMDWRPVWSADGRKLLFASDRGGSMNLWSVAVSPGSGAVRGEPRPLTTPSVWAGPFSLSVDGTRLAYVSRDDRARLHAVPFDPVAGRLLGEPAPVTSGGLRVYTWEASPDGEWFAFSSSGRQEDLYLVRRDGTGLRKLTDDLDKDRGVAWLDDERLVFYSSRGGRYEIWSVRTDASDLRVLTETTGDALWMPQVSPDGSRLLAYNAAGTFVFEMKGERTLRTEDARHLARFPDTDGVFRGSRWAPDGQRILGEVHGELGVTTLAVVDPSTAQLRIYPHPDGAAALAGGWLPEGGRFLATAAGQAFLVDAGTAEWRELGLSVPTGSVKLTADGHSLQYIHSTSEADIWLAEMR